MKHSRNILIALLIFFTSLGITANSVLAMNIGAPPPIDPNQKIRVWVNSDLATFSDKDDRVALAQMLLMSDRFDIRGMVFRSPNWVKDNVISAYRAEFSNLTSNGLNFQTPNFLNSRVYGVSTPFKQFTESRPVVINRHRTLEKLRDEAQAGHIYLLNWGPMTEVAFMYKWLLDNNKTDIINNITIVSHWTHNPRDFNFSADSNAARFLHRVAEQGKIRFYELGDSGQQMASRGTGTLNRGVVARSRIGRIMEQKWQSRGPDMSDAATYLALMGFGGGLDGPDDNDSSDDLTFNGRFDIMFADALKTDRRNIYRLVEERARLAASGSSSGPRPTPRPTQQPTPRPTQQPTPVPIPGIDQCNTTNQCRVTYGPAATDCKNSKRNNSVCMCRNQRCDAL